MLYQKLLIPLVMEKLAKLYLSYRIMKDQLENPFGSILLAFSEEKLLKKIQAVETEAIKIAYRLPPWTTNFWCYKHINFENILERLKSQSRKFLKNNSEAELIKPLIEASQQSMTGLHSAVYKAPNW